MNGHDFTLEQNTEARMMLAVARRGLVGAINDAENGIGHLSCDDPQTMNHIRAYWKRIHERYLETDSLIADLVACASHWFRGVADLLRRHGIRQSDTTRLRPVPPSQGCGSMKVTFKGRDRSMTVPRKPEWD